MDIIVVTILLTLAVVSCFALFMAWVSDSEDILMMRDFAKRFPDRCHVCSYHRYGQREGHITADTVVPEHNCKENA